jgi:hypothetical protein
MKTKTSKTVYSFVFILVMNVVNAQENFPDDTNDVPISDFIIPMIVLGIALGFLLIKKRKTA